MKNDQKVMRQGDVLLVRCDEELAGMKPVEREGGAVILAHGEVTGHAHAVRAREARLYTNGADRFLRVVRRAVQLRHEEHGPIEIVPGIYRVVRQREYSPEEIRNVAD